MCRQNPIFRRTWSATRQAVGTFLVGTDEEIAGNALIEFAIIAPLLVVMCIYVIDFGFLLPSPDGIEPCHAGGRPIRNSAWL